MKKLLLIFTLFSFFAEAQKISELPSATTITGTELVPIFQSGTKKATVQQLLATPTTYVTQTGNYVLTDYTATDGVCKNWVVTGNSTNTISVPTGNAPDGNPKWINGSGATFDNTKKNYVYTCAIDGHITYNIVKTSLGTGPDVTAPTFTFSPLNSATGVSITGNITITANEALYTTSNDLITNSNVASVVQLKLTNSSGSTVSAAATISGNIITIDPTASLTNSTVYYAAILPVEDLAGNASSTQSITFTTVAAGDVTAPTFSNNAVSSITTTGASYSATINETGTLYWILTTSATAPSKSAIAAGTGAVGTNFATASVTASTPYTIALTGLTASTTYYVHAYAKDASNNETAVQTAVNFTTSGASNSDDFNRADNASVPGTGYTSVAGTWGVSSNKLYVSSGLATGATVQNILTKNIGVTSYSYSLDYFTTQTTDDFHLFRYVDANNYWLIQVNHFAGSVTLKLLKFVAGVYSAQIGSTATVGTGSTGITTTVKVVVSGNNIEIFANNVSTGITTTDAQFSTSTTVGVRHDSGSTYAGAMGNRYDNLVIE